MPRGKPYSIEYKTEIAAKALREKEQGRTFAALAAEIGVHSTLIGKWVKQYGPEESEPEIPEEILEEFGVDESHSLRINDEYRREAVIVALVLSGYTVWQTLKNGDFYIHYE